MPEIPEEMSLLWIARFLGKSPHEMYQLHKAGLGPNATKRQNKYVVTRQSFILWLATRKKGGNN